MLLTIEEEHALRWKEEAPHIPYGLCQCGCGNLTKIAPYSRAENGWVAGCPIRFIHTHAQNAGHRAKAEAYRHRWAQDAPSIPYGCCWCRCGEQAPISTNTDPKRGFVKGEPRHYVMNHHRRKSGVPYIVEDRGYETPCWIWQRRIDKKGYAVTYIRGVAVPAHRVYWEREYGRMPDDYDAHHLCEMKPCVNYEHVTPLDHAEHSRMHQLQYWQERHACADLDLSRRAADEIGLTSAGRAPVKVAEESGPKAPVGKLPDTGAPQP